MLHIVGGHIVQLRHLLEGADGHGAAEHQLQVLLGGVAVLLCVGGHLVHSGVDLLLGVLVRAHAVLLGQLGGPGTDGQRADGVIAQVLVPRHLALIGDLQEHLGGVADDLGVHGLGAVQAVVRGIAAVEDAVLAAHIVIVHLGRRVLLAVDGHSGLAPLQHAGVIHQHRRRHQHEHRGDDAVQRVGLAGLGPFLRLADQLGVGDALCRQILAELLFS